MTETILAVDEATEAGGSGYRFSWGLAIAGGVTAVAVTFLLLTLGAGFGLLLVDPLARPANALPSFLTGGGIYFFAAMAFGFAAGGHLAGRLLGPLVESQIQEDFRAGAHGLVAWAVAVIATLLIVALAGATAAATGAQTAALFGMAPARGPETRPTGYLVDKLVRPGAFMRASAVVDVATAEARTEAGRLLDQSVARGEPMSADDRARLIDLVSTQAGITRPAATARVDNLVNAAVAEVRNNKMVARRVASYASLWLAASLLFGAIVSVGGAIFARIEDDRQTPRA